MPLLMQPSILLTFFAAAAHGSLILSLLCTVTLKSLSIELCLSWVDPSLCCPPGLFFHRCKTLHLSLLNFKRSLSAYYCILSKVLLQGGSPFQSVYFAIQFGTIGTLHQGTLDPIIHITYEDIKKRWAQYGSLGAPTCDKLPV